jgi:hypothetical protein
MSNLLKNLLFALGLAALLLLGYVAFLRDSESVTSESGAASQEVERETQKLLAKTQLLNSFEIDGSFFSDQKFLSLVDNRIELIPETVGRENPFAPLR